MFVNENRKSEDGTSGNFLLSKVRFARILAPGLKRVLLPS